MLAESFWIAGIRGPLPQSLNPKAALAYLKR